MNQPANHSATHSAAHHRRWCAIVAFIACIVALLSFALFPHSAHATGSTSLAKGNVRIHVLPFDDMDAIIVECDGRFGVVDSAEDSLSPDGSDFLYPNRPGVTQGQGKEAEVIAYMHKIGVTKNNLDFYIGTHPHSDHIGTAVQIIHEFHPATIYTPVYDDSFITNPSYLWDNQFVYDRLLAAVEWAQSDEGYGARFVQHLDPDFTDLKDPDEGDGSGDGDGDGDEGTGGDGSGDGNEGDGSDSGEGEGGEDPDKPTTPEEPEDPADKNTGSPVFKLGSATVQIVNYDETYQKTKVPDANYFSYGVKVTAKNGRTAFLGGDMNNYTDGDGKGVGDEDRLKATLGKIDFLKMAHHGRSGSNTPDYLRTVLKAAQGSDRSVVVQTGRFALMPWETVQVLNEKGARHFQASAVSKAGHDAFVADLTASGVKTNCDGDQAVIFQLRSDAPYACLYQDGLPYATTGWVEGPDGNQYFFGKPGVDAPSSTPVTNRWATLDGDRVFIGNQGYKALGWQKIEDVWYYFNSDGSLRYDWQQISGKWYYLDPTTGAMATGWMDIGSKRYYFDPQGGAMKTGWADIDGGRYYFDANGVMTSGKGWMKKEGTWYYATSSGEYKTGWLKDKGKWYYLKESGAMVTGWAQVDNVWYYLNGSGVMQTGWKKLGKTWYHLKGSGAMTVGWLKDKGKWYYLKESGAMATGWQEVEGTWYRLNGSGVMQKGWQKVGGKWYHLQSSGAMTVGWLDDKGKRYYLSESGAMLTGTQVIDGVEYRFTSSGALR